LKRFKQNLAYSQFSHALGIYAKEKARLKTKGKILDDFDLLIGATAIFNSLILVTKNVSDFDRLEGIIIEDWTS
jgi:tRNA(fMet)-specific endonuclease VapC